MKKTHLKAGVLCMVAAGLISFSEVSAQSDPTGKRRITDTYAITNATVFSAPEKAGMKATVLIKDGVIVEVGSSVNLPSEAKTIAGDSLFIYPGFIDGASDAGITKPADPERPEGFVSSNPPDEIAGITPWRSAMDQFSIKNSKVDELRKNGFTIAQILPEGGMLAGKAALVVLGTENSTNLLSENTALAASFSGSRGMYPGTAAGVMAKFRDIYKNSELNSQRSEKYNSVAGVKRPEITPTSRGMQDVINGNVPVIFSASSDLEIRRAMSLQEEFGFNLILTDLEDYESIIGDIKSSGAKVLIKLEVPDDKAIKKQEDDVDESTKAQYERVKESYDKALAQAGKLAEAEIPFAFTTKGVKTGDIMKSLQAMITNGLSQEDALAALTTNPAQILGISSYAGTVEKGKMANLVISTDSLFAEDSQIKHVVVDGYLFDYEIKPKKKSSNGEDDGEVDLSGKWEYETESPAGSSEGSMEISKDGDDYSGTITYDDPAGSGPATAPISNFNLEGNSVSFSFGVVAEGMNIEVTVTGVLDGNTIEGTMSVGEYGSFPFEATRNPSLILKN